MNDDVAIKVEHVSKTFRLPHEKQNSIKGSLIGLVKGGKRTYEKQQVLKEVSFEIKKGEFFGIVGRNGSGKSTLLKMLAGIYSPSQGNITVNGKLTPFIELGVGFNPELTGRENVFLNGALLGFNRKEMLAMYDDIVEFAELSKFMDQKLKNYSSGMQVRLAFSIAIRARSEILLIDEVLAVGDTSFQKKCYEVFTSLRKAGRTIVFVTHDMSAVERFCDRAMVMHESKSMGVYTPSEASAIYDQINASKNSPELTSENRRWGNGLVNVDNIEVHSSGEKLRDDLAAKTGQELAIKIKTSSKIKTKIVIGLAFIDIYGINIAGPNSKGKSLYSNTIVTYKIDKLSLLPGKYKITVAVFDEEVTNEYDHLENALVLNVKADSHNVQGKVNFFGDWT